MTELSLIAARERTERATPELARRPRRRRRLGPGRTSAGGLAVGPLLLLAAWTAGSATGIVDPATLSPP
jgi:sulfonate transport system permease protein